MFAFWHAERSCIWRTFFTCDERSLFARTLFFNKERSANTFCQESSSLAIDHSWMNVLAFHERSLFAMNVLYLQERSFFAKSVQQVRFSKNFPWMNVLAFHERSGYLRWLTNIFLLQFLPSYERSVQGMKSMHGKNVQKVQTPLEG